MHKYEDSRRRKTTQGFSLRDSLVSQGCDERGIRLHSDFIMKTLQVNPLLDIERYTVDKDNPNNLPLMG